MLYLEFARRKRGWTQKQLGQLTHIFQSFISLVEVGRGIPTPNQLDQLARALDVPPELLLKPVGEVVTTPTPTQTATEAVEAGR